MGGGGGGQGHFWTMSKSSFFWGDYFPYLGQSVSDNVRIVQSTEYRVQSAEYRVQIKELFRTVYVVKYRAMQSTVLCNVE